MGIAILKLGGLSIVAAMLLSTATFAQDTGTDDPVTEPVTHQVINDGNQSATDDLPVSDDRGADPTDGDQGIAVGEPDPNDDGSAAEPAIDPGTDDGKDVGVDEGTVDQGTVDEGTVDESTIDYGTIDNGSVDGGIVDEGDGTVTIYTMDGGPCIDCNVVVPGRPTNPTEVQRSLTAKAPVALIRRHSTAAVFAAPSAMTQCLTAHPRATWICEWQNGAGQ